MVIVGNPIQFSLIFSGRPQIPVRKNKAELYQKIQGEAQNRLVF